MRLEIGVGVMSGGFQGDRATASTALAVAVLVEAVLSYGQGKTIVDRGVSHFLVNPPRGRSWHRELPHRPLNDLLDHAYPPPLSTLPKSRSLDSRLAKNITTVSVPLDCRPVLGSTYDLSCR